MSKRRALITGLILVVLAGGISAGFASMCGGEESSRPREARDRDGTTPSAARFEGSGGPIRFVLDERYRAGETIDVVIENVGSKVYMFESFYPGLLPLVFRLCGAAVHHPAR